MRLKNIKLGWKLTGGICFLLLAVCGGIGLLSYEVASRSLQHSIEVSLPTLARESSNYIRLKLDTYIIGIESVANRQVIQNMDWEKQRSVLVNETKRLGYLDMGVVTAEGKATFSAGDSTQIEDSNWVKKAFAGNTVFSDVIIDPASNQPVILVGTPIRDGAHKIAAALIAKIDGFMPSHITDRIKYGEKGYSYIINKDGALIAHNNRDFVLKARNFMEESKTRPEYRRLSDMMQRMIRREAGFDEYWFMGSDRLFGFAPIADTQWSIAVGAIKDEIFTDIYAMRLTFLLSCTGFILVSAGLAVFFARSIVVPIRECVGFTELLAKGDFSRDVPQSLCSRGDEIGDLGRSFQTMAQNTQNLLKKMRTGVQTIASSATGLSVVSAQTAQSVQTLSGKTTAVAAAAEESSANTASVAASMEQASANLSSVAGATEEMSATIGEIAANSEKARAISSEAGTQAASTSCLMQQLGEAAREIGKVTETIADISAQTNLLALNATIEAARAGAAGKGFAVVANEIKALAKQTAAATEDIKAKIGDVQSSSISAITDIDKITRIIKEVSLLVASIATAIEEQATVTRDVALNIAQASAGVREANEQVAQTATVSCSMAQDIAGVDAATGEIRSGGDQVRKSAAELSQLAEQLKGLMGQFQISTST